MTHSIVKAEKKIYDEWPRLPANWQILTSQSGEGVLESWQRPKTEIENWLWRRVFLTRSFQLLLESRLVLFYFFYWFEFLFSCKTQEHWTLSLPHFRGYIWKKQIIRKSKIRSKDCSVSNKIFFVLFIPEIGLENTILLLSPLFSDGPEQMWKILQISILIILNIVNRKWMKTSCVLPVSCVSCCWCAFQ